MRLKWSMSLWWLWNLTPLSISETCCRCGLSPPQLHIPHHLQAIHWSFPWQHVLWAGGEPAEWSRRLPHWAGKTVNYHRTVITAHHRYQINHCHFFPSECILLFSSSGCLPHTSHWANGHMWALCSLIPSSPPQLHCCDGELGMEVIYTASDVGTRLSNVHTPITSHVAMEKT